ncbi:MULTISPECIES: hypothetical protein [unclassified Modicisalibacter]|uniref:hypothetical protein n=1 Tax=unclassified Modicisalibacter TaxID=2679913 RepID=UPI001CCFC570|nr:MULTISPECIES: hypothetical protein [unclassified Modicisalibacter]MBZ9559984.1 hypothetical protein [Modicisalibacter sp. R2A 31.J]MBZ9575893.1 hypothetical protein [Modicisalibacter sp. MOD 31.J]
MSVINRIEVANLLNKHGDIASPWDAKMRHLCLDLRGQSSAISMENGFGKTTLAEALIGLLSRDRTLLARTRRKCSPSSVAGQSRSWTHLRVEFRAGDAARQDDMLAAAGEEVAGETFVFGVYGYSDGSGLSFYHYPGGLEDIPVHHLTRDGKLALYANADVQAFMRRHGVTRSANREEWLEAVGEHVSRRELAQMAAFQKEGGADKSQIFNAIKPRAGEKADQAFFFEVLAPQILSGATRGETDEGEELIEDVILNSGTKVTELRHRLTEAESDQKRAADKVARLADLNAQGEALLDARARLDELDTALAAGERLLGGQALLALPGLPCRPAADDEADPALIAGLAWGEGDSARPRVSTWLLARLSGQHERRVREALAERGARVDGHRRLIHLPEASWPLARDVHHLAFEAAREWLADSQAFADDSARYRALAALDAAAEAFETLDGNRFREEVIADREYLKELKADIQRLDDDWQRLDGERERLESRQREFTDNQSFYTQALAEGLFSENELESPEVTQAAAEADAGRARQALSSHLARVGELRQPARWHAEFRDAHPDTTPGELLALKREQHEALGEEREALDAELASTRTQRDAAREERDRLAGERARLEGERGLLAQGQEAWQAFIDGWPDASIEGFWTRRKTALADARQTEHEARRQRDESRARHARLAPLAEAAARYAELHGDEDPVHLRDRLHRQARELDDRWHRLDNEETRLRGLHRARLAFAELDERDPKRWLEDARARYPRLLSEAETLDAQIDARQRYLESLSGDPLARQVAEAEAHALLDERAIAFVPLHEALNRESVDPERRRDWLAQAAGQLFAPVVEGETDAERAAECLIERGLNVPVVEAGRLAECLTDGRPPLGAIQGVETLAVKAAFDPQYLSALRDETQRRLDAERQRREALDAEIERLDPHGERFALALDARQADDEDVEAVLETLADQRRDLMSQRQALAPRLEESALATIDDFQRYLLEGGERALAEAAEELARAETCLAELGPRIQAEERELETHGATWLAAEKFADAGGVERLETLTARLAELGEAHELAGERLAEADERAETLDRRRAELDARLQSLFADGERERLRSLEAFEAEGGVAFMATAEAVEAELETALATANRRAGFDFARIRAYLEVRDDSGGSQQLEHEIARLKRERDATRDERRARSREQETVEARLADNQQALAACDQLAVAWMERVRELPGGWTTRLAALDDLTAASRWPHDHPQHEVLDAELDDWRRLAGSMDGDADQAVDLAALTACQQSLLGALGELNLGERARNRERQAREVAQGERHLAEAVAAAGESRAFNDTERARLASLEGVSAAALDDLRALYAQLDDQLAEHRQRVERLHATREQIEGTLVERLGSIITDAAGNLDVLRRVARRSSEGGAYFEVRAALIGDAAVRELIQQLLADIDEHQAAARRRLDRDGTTPAGEQRRRDEELARQIRRRIYRGLFRDVSIRLKHDAIRPHGRLFSLNEDMSEGQREAVSLMWLVKLSEFAIERELRELPGHHKRRARAGRESVILLDGLFSKLSHRRLIQDSLESLRNTRGRFQMIGLIHNPNYENDAAIFPTYLVGSVIGGAQGQGGHVVVRDGRAIAPEAVGRGHGEASLFGIHVTEPSS